MAQPSVVECGSEAAGARRGVVVIGAGPYGLSVAAHLRAAGVAVRVFGEVMGSWRHVMATGMFLKSAPQATDLAAPAPGGRLADFCRQAGLPELTELTPIPSDLFVRYGTWFANRFAGEVEDTRVAWLNRRRDGGFHLVLDDGAHLQADAVVVACGLRPLAHVPRVLADLAPQGTGPRSPVSHSSDHSCLSGYAGQQIAVVGGGQSAMESAALLHESGALVEVLVRGTRARWGQKPTLHRPLGQRIAHPASPLGPGWALSALCRAPAAVGQLPAPARLWLMRRALGPSGAWWLRDRVEGVIPVRTDAPIRHACLQDGKVRLVVGDAGAELTVDHVLAATGYRIDVDALPFLASGLRSAIARIPGSKAPQVTASFEASVPGLYFTGSMAAPTFGPMLRFVAGTHFAAVTITRHLARQRRRSRTT
ncbi:FAD-dependent oxidoreductase [Nonomuraea mangrovi]|uniref:FAD-dependent oxidoreductase n=1 Tax=Nonomuraea mangrovi TaxID=2316207 RepID=A0ABW4T2T9_9ACTN